MIYTLYAIKHLHEYITCTLSSIYMTSTEVTIDFNFYKLFTDLEI